MCLDSCTTSPAPLYEQDWHFPDNKVHGANMGLTWGRQAPGEPHVGDMNITIWVGFSKSFLFIYVIFGIIIVETMLTVTGIFFFKIWIATISSLPKGCTDVIIHLSPRYTFQNNNDDYKIADPTSWMVNIFEFYVFSPNWTQI